MHRFKRPWNWRRRNPTRSWWTPTVKQPDGSYRLQGVKPNVTCGDSDLLENMVLCVLARIEGAPADAGGLSLFIVPKYLVNANGSLGARNDYTITGVEKKLGLHGSPTVALAFGENGVLPGVDGLATAFKSKDLSSMTIPDAAF